MAKKKKAAKSKLSHVCNSFAETFCRIAPGCSWKGSECVESAIPCEEIKGASSCGRREDCDWDLEAGKCKTMWIEK